MHLQNKRGISSGSIDLRYGGKVLDNARTLADYDIVAGSSLSLIFINAVNETLPGATLAENSNGGSRSLSKTTVVGIVVLLLVLLVTVPLVAYKAMHSPKGGEDRLMNVYAATYSKDGSSKPFERVGSQNNQSAGTEESLGGIQDPQSFLDLVFDRFDLDPAIFSSELATARSQHPIQGQSARQPDVNADNTYESVDTLRKVLRKEAKRKGSLSFDNYSGGGESDTDSGKTMRNGIFQFRMTTSAHDERDDGGLENGGRGKTKKKMKKKVKKTQLKVGKRVLQPQWFHGDTARPPTALTDQLQYDDSDMFVAAQTGPNRTDSRLVGQQSSGYSETLRRHSPQRPSLMPPPTTLFEDGHYADASRIQQADNGYADVPKGSRAEIRSPEGFEDLPPASELPHDDGFGRGSNSLFEGGYIETSADSRRGQLRTAARRTNGVVGEYIDTNSSPSHGHNDFGYIDGIVMRDGDGYIDSNYIQSLEFAGRGDEYMSPIDNDDDEYLRAEKHDTNDEYVYTDGEVITRAGNGDNDDADDADEDDIFDASKLLAASQQDTLHNFMPMDGRFALPQNASALARSLPGLSLPGFHLQERMSRLSGGAIKSNPLFEG